MAQEKKVTQSTDNQTTQNDPNQPQVLGGSSQGAVTSPTARVASFSSGQQQTPGSGRFTNIQKYLDANKSATDSLGAKANKTFNTQFETGQKDVDEKNQALSAAFNKGRETLQTGQGFNEQLKQIGTGLDTGFTDFGNRQGFDTAGQQAMALAQNQDYGNIASGQGIDETGLTTQQQQALQGAQGLLGNVQTNLSGLETEQGRSNLFSKVLQPKQGYTSGQRSFDQLFLGGALGGIKSNLQNQRNTANQLQSSTAGQQKTVDELISGESALTSGLTEQATTNQNIFDRVFGDQKNIDFINNLRNQRYEGIKSGLEGSGSISREDANLLGVGNLGSTFINDNRPAATGDLNSQVVNDNQLLGTYNLLNDPANVNKYISRGQNAASTQDITTQPDYDAYKALQTLALGRDTGKIGGVSQLDSAVKSTGQLATDISAADKAFRDNYGNNNYQNSSAFQGINVGNNQTLSEIGMYNGGNQVGNVGQVGNTATNDADAQSLLNSEAAKAKYFTDLNRPEYSTSSGFVGDRSGGTGQGLFDFGPINYDVGAAGVLAQSNIGDYLKSNDVNRSSQTYAVGPSASRNISQAQAASDLAQANLAAQRGEQITADRLKGRLNEIINREGVRNSLDIVDQAPQYSRFRGLV